MKRKILTVTGLTLTVGLVVIFTSCNSGTGSNADNASGEIKTTIEMIEGVWEYLPPTKGFGIMYENYYSYMFDMPDSTKWAHSGTYEVLNDTITNTVIYSSNETMVGYQFKWTADSFESDTITITTYDIKGNPGGTVQAVKRK